MAVVKPSGTRKFLVLRLLMLRPNVDKGIHMQFGLGIEISARMPEAFTGSRRTWADVHVRVKRLKPTQSGIQCLQTHRQIADIENSPLRKSTGWLKWLSR